MRILRVFSIFVCFLIPFSYAAGADLFSLKIRLGDKLTISRNVAELKKFRDAAQGQNFGLCLQLGARLDSKWPEIKDWIALYRLSCARVQFQKKPKSYDEFARLVHQTSLLHESLLVGSASGSLRAELVESYLSLIEAQSRARRAQAWENIGKALEITGWMDVKQKAKLYRLAGELSLAQQNVTLARDYLTRSLSEEPNHAVQARLDVLLKTIDPKSSVAVAPILNAEHFDATQEEIEVFNRMNEALKSGDLIAAVEDGVRILREYPGGRRAQEAAKQVLNIYLSLAGRSDEKYQLLSSRVLGEMRKVDGERLFAWAQALVSREKFSDAVTLSQQSLERIEGQPLSTHVLMLAAQSAHHVADFKKAREYYDKLVREHAGTRSSAEAIFRLGLLDFREGKYAEASNHFERFLQLESSSDFELSSLYWLWRCRQKLNSPKANEAAERLVARYPISYFGIRARAELAGHKVTFLKELKKTPEWTFSLTSSEKKSWERFLIFLKAGWEREAQREIAFLNEPVLPEGKLIYAYILSETGDHYRTSEVLYRTFSLDPTLVAGSTLRLGYPRSFMVEVKREASRYKIPPELVLALIKQESSFRTDVRSPAGALGLMQLMPATARELAGDMRIKIRDLTTDLINPALNIRIGTQYLNRRVRAFEGNIPMALAAYNAGIGNIRGWQASRLDLKDIFLKNSSAPDDEIWLDELPWSETTGYIKSILRNYLIYKWLDQGDYELASPVWKMG